MSFRVSGGSINPGVTFRWDGWSWPDGSDRGAQYFSGHPLNPNGKLVITDENKILGTDRRFSYGFRITNEGPNAVNFDVEGGGYT